MDINIKNRQDFSTFLESKTLLCDGAMGTSLQSFGYKGPSDQLNLDSEAIKRITGIHLEYIMAGSDIIQTNTFGASFLKLEHSNLSSAIDTINCRAVEAAKNAVEIYREKTGNLKPVFIAGDVGPSGELLEPYGDIAFNTMEDSYSRQIEILLKEGIDFILIETMMDINEAIAAVSAARKMDKEITIACSMSFKENGITVMGSKAESFGSFLLDAGCNIIGANCSVGSDSMITIAEKIRNSYPNAKLLIQPNAGLPGFINGETVFSETPEIMAANFREILKYKPQIVGACCGSTPGHIKRLSEVLSETLQ